MPVVVIEGISREESPHEGGKTDDTAAQQDMCVIWHQRPGVDACAGFRRKLGQPKYKVLAILIIVKDPFSLYSPDNDMV